MSSPQTLFEKIWQRHLIHTTEAGDHLLYVDRLLVHEGPFYAFDGMRRDKRAFRRPKQIFAFPDHYIPTVVAERQRGLAGIKDPEMRVMVEQLARNTAEVGIPHFGMDDPRQGIMHVAAPELGVIHPGMTVGGTDSHTATHGAFGAFSSGIGASQAKHIMATTTLWWQAKPKTMRVEIEGALAPGVTAKDVALTVMARLGVSGGAGHVIEYAGSTVRAMSMEGRMTLCNMTIEAGARSGMVSPDETTIAYLQGRPYAPKGGNFERAAKIWRAFATDAGAGFDKEVTIDATAIVPSITWGTRPEEALPVTGTVPDPAQAKDAAQRTRIETALRYMGLTPGTALTSVKVDRVFIGSCTNGRIEDLRAAAAVAKGRKAVIPAIVVPGSRSVKAQAEAEGLHEVFASAGFEWRDSGCSFCVASNGDHVPPGERCASTSNRNFENRQGANARTHLMSPAMAAAAAVTGRITDVRELGA
ncbi:MAG TPA: 3-isopropylmalate dehydratase large subunit [Burkholderiales bacterium]|nr:3-isopropylmalate dehydratase large subunit [Burkholderiales bacterium]